MLKFYNSTQKYVAECEKYRKETDNVGNTYKYTYISK